MRSVLATVPLPTVGRKSGVTSGLLPLLYHAGELVAREVAASGPVRIGRRKAREGGCPRQPVTIFPEHLQSWRLRGQIRFRCCQRSICRTGDPAPDWIPSIGGPLFLVGFVQQKHGQRLLHFAGLEPERTA